MHMQEMPGEHCIKFLICFDFYLKYFCRIQNFCKQCHCNLRQSPVFFSWQNQLYKGQIWYFWWHLHFSDILVLVTYYFRWCFSFCDTWVLVVFKFWWHFGLGYFCFGDISVSVTFQFWWHFRYIDISVLEMLHFWSHLNFSDILVFGTFEFWCLFSFG